MQTCSEALPLEIWLSVFQYLEAHDLLQGFQNLNQHFDQILNSTHLFFHLRWKKTDANRGQIPAESYWSDSVLNRVICLRPAVQSPPTYFSEFLRCHANKFIRLESLSIKADLRDALAVPSICQSLRELPRLECLILNCVPFRIVFETILALPTLRICQLILQDSAELVDINLLHVRSPIKQLFLTFLGRVKYSLINTLLTYTPELKRLELCGFSFSFESMCIFSQPLFTLPEIRTLKIKVDGGFIAPECFRCLPTISPGLKQFYLHYEKHLLIETFFNHYITDWWPVIEPIQRFHIFIKGHMPIMGDNAVLEKNLQQYQQTLSDKTNQLQGLSKFQWNERKLGRFILIEMTISRC